MMTAGANCTKSPLRVLHVIGGGDRGGALSLVVPLIAALRRKGVEAEILCLGEGILAERAQERAIPVQVLPMRHAADARVLPKLWAAVFEAGRDVVHTHGARANFAVRVLWPFMVQRPRLVTTVHSDIRLDYTRAVRGRFFGWADRLTASFADLIVCVSADLRSRLVARGYPPQKLAVIRPGLELFAVEEKCSGEADWGWADSERADSARRGGAAHCEELPEAMQAIDKPDALWVGTVTRLVPVKDLDLMLESFAWVAAELPEARLAVVGDGPEKPRLEAHAAQLGLGERVAFTGWVSPSAMALRRFRVFWLTSRYEGISLSILEAMAAGLPVVATNVGGIGEAVESGYTGYLVSRGDRRTTAREMAALVTQLLRDPELCRSLGEQGRRRVHERFSLDKAARLYARIYERLCKEGN